MQRRILRGVDFKHEQGVPQDGNQCERSPKSVVPLVLTDLTWGYRFLLPQSMANTPRAALHPNWFCTVLAAFVAISAVVCAAPDDGRPGVLDISGTPTVSEGASQTVKVIRKNGSYGRVTANYSA